MNQEQVDHEVQILVTWITENGTTEGEDTYVLFGKLFSETQDIFEALTGTLKAAKKKGLIAYGPPIMLKGSHDKEKITLVKK